MLLVCKTLEVVTNWKYNFMSIIVTFLYSGIDYLHPDFEGRVDQTLGVDFIDTDSDGMDFNGHGTHVTGQR